MSWRTCWKCFFLFLCKWLKCGFHDASYWLFWLGCLLLTALCPGLRFLLVTWPVFCFDLTLPGWLGIKYQPLFVLPHPPLPQFCFDYKKLSAGHFFNFTRCLLRILFAFFNKCQGQFNCLFTFFYFLLSHCMYIHLIIWIKHTHTHT